MTVALDEAEARIESLSDALARVTAERAQIMSAMGMTPGDNWNLPIVIGWIQTRDAIDKARNAAAAKVLADRDAIAAKETRTGAAWVTALDERDAAVKRAEDAEQKLLNVRVALETGEDAGGRWMNALSGSDAENEAGSSMSTAIAAARKAAE